MTALCVVANGVKSSRLTSSRATRTGEHLAAYVSSPDKVAAHEFGAG